MGREKRAARAATMRTVSIPTGPFEVEAEERIPPDARGLVILAGGAIDPDFSEPMLKLVEALSEAGFATLHVPPLSEAGATPPSDLSARQHTARQRYDLHRAVQTLLAATDWHVHSDMARLPVAYVGMGQGVAAVLHAAAARTSDVAAVAVIDGGTEIAARDLLERVQAPTLCITDENRSLADSMLGHLQCEHAHVRVPGRHPLGTPEGLEETSEKAREWLQTHVRPRPSAGATVRQSGPEA